MAVKILKRRVLKIRNMRKIVVVGGDIFEYVGIIISIYKYVIRIK